MTQAGFEPAIPASERQQTDVLDRAARYRVFCMHNALNYFFSPVAQKPPVGQGLLIVGASRSHTDTHSLGRTPLDE